MATVDFTATHEGHTATRSSGTMPYVAAVFGVGVTWHKSFAAAHKAARSGQHTWNNPAGGTVVPAVPVKFNGKATHRWPETATEGWGDIPASVMAELLADKIPAAEVIAEALEIDAEATAVVEAERTPVTRYYVSRDTDADNATDETRAMAHVAIHSGGDDLADAQYALQQAMLSEANSLRTGGCSQLIGPRDAWRFRRVAALLEASDRALELDPSEDNGRSSITVEGLRFTIVAVTR